MSDVTEHSDSEFYYPDDLSDAELLQQPTSFGSEEKKSKLLKDEEVHNFIRRQTRILSASLMKINLSPMILTSLRVQCDSYLLFTSATEQDRRQGK